MPTPPLGRPASQRGATSSQSELTANSAGIPAELLFLFHISFDTKKKHQLGIAQLANLQRYAAVSFGAGQAPIVQT